jgi:hypothetical protein
MKWIVQNGFKCDAAYTTFLEHLDRMGVDVTYVKTIPFSDETDPPLPSDLTNVVCFGSIGLGRIAKRRNWTPGVWLNENFDMRRHHQFLGKEMFNEYYLTGTIEGMDDIHEYFGDEFFIRPVLDDKSFSGQVITKEEFYKWRQQVRDLAEMTLFGKDSYVTVTPYTDIIISPIKDIAAEYRFMVVDKEVVTGSRYKFGQNIIHLPFDKIDEHIIQYARDRAAQYQPDRAFVLDIAIDENGSPKVLELGCINACGMYMADTQKLIDAIERMEF